MKKRMLKLFVVLMFLFGNIAWSVDIKNLQKRAAQGDVGAQTVLGGMYGLGRGVPQNYVEAVRLYRLAAEQGDADAQIVLGGMYYLGRGVPQDYAKAYMWANFGAVSGNSDSIKVRDKVASLMTREQLAEAQNMVRDCLAKKLKSCD